MATVQSAKPSFASGEIARRLYGRFDYKRYDTGLARCENFCVMPAGGLTRRPPTEFISAAYEDSILLSHEIRQDDAFIIELGDETARFFRLGGVVLDGETEYEVEHPYTAADLPKVRAVTSGDLVYLTHGQRGLASFSRNTNTDWTVADLVLEGGPFLDENTDDAKLVKADDRTGSVTLTATGFTFDAGHAGALFKLREADQTGIKPWTVGASIGVKDSYPGSYIRHDGRVYRRVDGVSSTRDVSVNPPVHTEGVWSQGGAGVEAQVHWQYVRDDYGLVRITSVAVGGATADAEVLIELPEEFTEGSGSKYWSAGAFSDVQGYPDTISIHEERLSFGQQIRLFFSAAGNYLDFAPKIGPQYAINRRIGSTSRRANDILWMTSGSVMLVGTSGEEYSVSGATQKDGITQDSARAVPATEDGSIPHDAVRAGSAVLHVAANGRRVHEILYDFQVNAFVSNDITIQSEHITSPGIKKIVWQKNPMRIAWVILSNGELRALTYMKEQETIAWHRQDLSGGLVDDAAIMPSEDGSYDELWLIVRRGEARNIERMREFFDPEAHADPMALPYLDSQISYSGTPVSVVSGADHLEGQEVGIVTEGGFMGTAVVSGGDVPLTGQSGEVTVGLLYRSWARLLPTYQQMPDGSSSGRMRDVSGLALNYIGGPGALVGNVDDVDGLEEVTLVSPLADAPPVLQQGVETVPADGFWTTEDFLDVVMDAPFAFDLLGADRIIEMGA